MSEAAEAPTLGQYVRHADLYGTDCVYETAERHLNASELLQLDRTLTDLDTERRKRFQKVPTRKRMPRERKMRAVLFLVDEGLPHSRIAKQLGVSERQIRRLVSEGKSDTAADTVEPPSGSRDRT